MDLSFPFPRHGTRPDPPVLLAAVSSRAAASPTALAQARLPVRVDPADAAFDVAAATVITRWRSG